jgi:hypothetical protein
MQILWRTLLLIALCVQLPTGAIASYAANSSHDHQHSHDTAAESHHVHTSTASHHEESNEQSDCAVTHHHCTANHLSLMVQTHLSTLIDSLRDVFDLRTEAFFPADLLPSIERPKWVSI